MANINKKITSVLISLLVLFSTFVFSFDEAYAKDFDITGKAGIIYLADTDEVLWSKGTDYVCDIASITKLVTAEVSLEYLNVNDTIIFDDEKMSIDDLLHLVLMESNNDAAQCLAEEAAVRAGIDMTSFISLMNEHVNNIGCTNTKLYNPSGLYDENMVTIEDVVKIAKSAFSNSTIRNIAGLAKYRLANGREVTSTNDFITGRYSLTDDPSWPAQGESTEENTEGVEVTGNENNQSSVGVPKIIAAKTGTCGHADYHANMVALLEINGMECYVAVLDTDPDERFADMKKLINEAMGLINPYTVFQGNDEFEAAKLWGGSVNKVVGVAKENGLINLPAGVSPSLVTTEINYYENLTAPIMKGDVIGHINIFLTGEQVRSVELLANESVEKGWFLSKYRITNKQTIIGGAVIFIILFLFIMMLSIRASNLRKKKKLREQRLREEARKKLEIEMDRERRNWKYK